MVSSEARAGTTTALTAYTSPFTTVPSFKYLGRILSTSYDDWTVVPHNLRKARKKWLQLSGVMGR